MILVTGATGHLGANLVRRLLADGESVRVLLREDSSARAVEGLDVDRVVGDLRDPLAARAAARGCAFVYHAAGQTPSSADSERDLYDNNVLATRNLLAAARETICERVVIASSLSAIGLENFRYESDPSSLHPLDGRMNGGLARALVEQEGLRAAENGLEVVIAALPALVGPNDFKPSPIGRALLDFAMGRVAAYVDGSFEVISARDAIEGLVLAMQPGQSGQKYVFSTELLSTDQLLQTFSEVTAMGRAPQRSAFAASRLVETSGRADTGKAERELRYRRNMGSTAREAIRAAWEDFKKRGMVAIPISGRVLTMPRSVQAG